MSFKHADSIEEKRTISNTIETTGATEEKGGKNGCCGIFNICGSVISMTEDLFLPVCGKNGERSVPQRICHGLTCLTIFLFFLYFFLVGLNLMGDAFKALAGDSAGNIFGFASNPIAGLMVGILFTVMVQSSSTTTSIIVTAVGANVLEVTTAVPMIFGANIGTSVTNTIVSIGFAGNILNYERAFAGATVHDIFNIFNVILWLIIESISNAINGGDGGLLVIMTGAITKSFEPCDDETDDCEKWVSPIKEIAGVVSKAIISIDKDVIKDISLGRPDGDMCERLCEKDCGFKFSRKMCVPASANLAASSKTICGNTYLDGDENVTVSKKAKAKFTFCDYNATTDTYTIDPQVLEDAQTWYDDYRMVKGGFMEEFTDEGAGVFTLILSILMLCLCLFGLVKILNYVIRGSAERVVKKALNMNGYLAILVGCGITIFVQSSSVTTSILTPLVAVGVLSLEKMVPLTMGANIGTTFTGILAALVSDSADGFQIALIHVFFNVFGVVLFYPIPFIRAIPIKIARNLGKVAATFRPFPTFYIFFVFAIYPLLLLGISMGYENGSAGAIAGTTIALLFLIFIHVAIVYWYKRKGGREKLLSYIEKKNLGFTAEQRSQALKDEEEKDRQESEGSTTSTEEGHHGGATVYADSTDTKETTQV